ncbi:MAG: hypothetical protein QOH99_958, partial [Frankiaceae bacterium]|nr:hypothetical protein [Frankiaceae bacterium]
AYDGRHRPTIPRGQSFLSSSENAVASHRARRTRSPWLWPLLVVVLLAFLYVGAQAAVGLHDIPRGTFVAGVDVGGRTVQDAARLISENGRGIREPLLLDIPGDSQQSLNPAAAGLGIDAVASAQRAASRPWTPWGIAAALSGHRDLDPVIAVDEGKLTAAVTKLAAGMQSDFREGGISIAGTTATAVLPQVGKTLDIPDAVAKIRAAYLVSAAAIPVTMVTKTPALTAEEVQRALTEVARPALAAAVSLRVGDTIIDVPARTIAGALTFASSGGRLEPSLDGAELLAALGTGLTSLEVKPKDATIVLSGGKPTIVPSITGHVVTPEGVATAIEGVMTEPAPRTADLLLGDIQPTLTTAGAQALGVKEVVGEFTTYHPCCASRVTNIHTIANIVSGTLVLPGKMFDLNGIVGERDTARGFVSAPMIDHGLFTESIGGGVSQFATTTYNAAFFAGFPLVQYQTHSYYISRYPAGREATVSWPQPDLRWRNDSTFGALVTTSYTGTSLTVTIWGTKRYDIESVASARYRPTTAPAIVYNPKPGCERASGGPGFDIDVWRVFKVGGKETKREKYHTRYLPEPVIVCGPKPTPTPTPTVTSTATLTPTPTKPAPSKPTATKPTPKPTG